ncbi:phosphatidylglycerophosphatase A [bacterium]|nr:phosphatidylglycerophosphatase A [bacterium]
MKFINRLIATGFYSGYSPIAPGTAGSAVALLIFWFVPFLRAWNLLAACLVFLFLGVRSATEVEKMAGKKDPGIIVIDEIVGMWLSLLFLPAAMHAVWWIAAFFLFRLFDIVKPFPADSSQKLQGGWGVMIDDVIAGVYANLSLRVLFIVWNLIHAG